MEVLRLVGVAVVIVGIALGLRVTVVVLLAGLATGLSAGMPLVGTEVVPGLLDTLGRAFASQRIMTLFVLALPAIGLCERYGLQEQARRLVARIPAATVGRLELVYHLFRAAVGALGIRLGSGHVTFSRPIVVPMALGAAGLAGQDDQDRPEADLVKAVSAASENYANFFAQNLFFGAAGVALVVSTLADNGIVVDPRRVSLWAVPIAIVSVVLAAAQYRLVDRRLARRRAGPGAGRPVP